MRQRLAEKRKEKDALEAAEARERERIRRKAGQEMVAVKEKLKEDEIKKELMQRKREKEEDRLARERIRAQIEADKKARQEKLERERALREGKPVDVVPDKPAVVEAPTIQKNYNETRLQIRVPSGPPLTENFNADDKLDAVFQYLATKGFSNASLQTTFPRHVFTADERKKTLKDLSTHFINDINSI